jgi:hypothetical protein
MPAAATHGIRSAMRLGAAVARSSHDRELQRLVRRACTDEARYLPSGTPSVAQRRESPPQAKPRSSPRQRQGSRECDRVLGMLRAVESLDDELDTRHSGSYLLLPPALELRVSEAQSLDEFMQRPAPSLLLRGADRRGGWVCSDRRDGGRSTRARCHACPTSIFSDRSRTHNCRPIWRVGTWR